MGVWLVQSSRTSHLSDPVFGLMLWCCHVEILSTFWTRGCEPYLHGSLQTMPLVLNRRCRSLFLASSCLRHCVLESWWDSSIRTWLTFLSLDFFLFSIKRWNGMQCKERDRRLKLLRWFSQNKQQSQDIETSSPDFQVSENGLHEQGLMLSSRCDSAEGWWHPFPSC